jgi:predicted nucleic acid-binding protein
MKFWDSSAVVGLLVREQETERILSILRKDPEIMAWWATPIECTSAIARREREGHLDTVAVSQALHHLQELSDSWQEVQPVEQIKEISFRLLRVHNLRTADAMQLSAAILASEQRPSSLGFVCLDERLASIAQREGFKVIV